MVRILVVVLIAMVLLAMASAAFAYRLICIPVAEVLPEGMYKLEVAAPYNAQAPEGTPTQDEMLWCYRFDGTIYKGLEIAVKGNSAPGNARAGSTQVNLHYQAIGEKDGMPGLGFGIWNLYDSDDHEAPAGKLPVKESFFAGVFRTVAIPGMKLPVKLHLCWGTKQLEGLFGGVAIPLSKRFSAAAEYLPEASSDSKSLMLPGQTRHFVWALGYNQTPNWRFKYANIGGDNAWGVVYTSKWLQK